MNCYKLESLLRLKEYSIPVYKMTQEELRSEEIRRMESNNRIMGRSFHHTFSMWQSKWGRIPTPQEFVAMQMRDIKKKFDNTNYKRKYRVNFNWTPTIERGIKNRLVRSYVSFINELHTELSIKTLFPKCQVIRDTELDFEGVDLLVIDRKRRVEHKIHITKSSMSAIDFLFKKQGKKLVSINEGNLWNRMSWESINHSIYIARDFTGHVYFLYYDVRDGTTDGTIRNVNGYPLFTKRFIEDKIEINANRISK